MMKYSRQSLKRGSTIGGVIFLLVLGVYYGTVPYYKNEIYRREASASTLTESKANQEPVVAETQNSSSSVSLLFVGDMMFDRYIRQVVNKHSSDFLFSCINPLLQAHDVVIGNLEGPITSNPSTSMGTKVGSSENYFFTFPTTTATLLYDKNIRIVSLGNNHIQNQGHDGISQTHTALKESQVAYFGGLIGDNHVYRTRVQGIPISFISYNQFGGEKQDSIAKLISEEKVLGRVVIVYAHWGEEYQEETAVMRLTAKLFAESGADLIVGSHPHIVQSHEMIGSTPVYYSLGNFIFDQYFQDDVMKGLALSVTINLRHEITIEEHMVTLGKDGRTCPVQKSHN